MPTPTEYIEEKFVAFLAGWDLTQQQVDELTPFLLTCLRNRVRSQEQQ